MCGVKVPKIMEVILLVGNFDRAIFMSVCPWEGGRGVGGKGRMIFQTTNQRFFLPSMSFF